MFAMCMVDDYAASRLEINCRLCHVWLGMHSHSPNFDRKEIGEKEVTEAVTLGLAVRGSTLISALFRIYK